MRDLRVLTVRQPWAWAMIYGGKSPENRSRNLAGKYRGPVEIHVGLQIDDGYDRKLIGQAVGLLARAQAAEGLRTVAQRAGEPLARGNAISERFGNLGAVIGIVDLVDVHHIDPSGLVGCYCSPWAQPFENHLIVRDPIPLRTPVPARGRLGLWRPDEALAAAIWAQVGDPS